MTRATETRDFLLRSLDDLDAEYAAGDLEDADYQALRADYTRRAADAIRGMAGGDHRRGSQRAAVDAPDTSRLRTLAWVVGVLVVALAAGLLLARFSGSRGSGDTITGDIRTSTRELLSDAQQAFGGGDLDAAIEIYDEVLDLQPANTEALAYKAWFLRLSGETAASHPIVEDAVAIDPEYPDARVFAAAIALDLGDVDLAAAHLAAFDLLDAPSFMRDLVVQQGLRDRISTATQAAALVELEAAWPDPASPFEESGLDVGTVLAAAEELASRGMLFDGLTRVEAVLSARPDDVEALAGYGWLLGRSATLDEPSPAEIALSYLDRAVLLEPDDAPALVYRAFVHAFLGDVDAGSADLAAFESLSVRSAGLEDLVIAFDLHGQLAG